MINVEELLKPISPEKPCGPDLGYDPAYDEIEKLLKGTDEVEIGNVKKPAEPPNWGELEKRSTEFLRRSKHLRIATILCGSLARTGGLEGFRDGLALLKGLVEQYWAPVYPLLDPEDKNDPTQRLMILSALTTARGLVTGWLTMIEFLNTAPVSRPKGATPITFDDIQAMKLKEKGGDGVPPNARTRAQLTQAIRSDSNGAVASHKAVQDAIDSAKGLDALLTSTLGAGNTISFEVLHNTLKEIADGIAPFLDGAASEPGAAPGDGSLGADAADTGTGAGGAVGIQISGSIRSREDVVKALDSICRYYEQAEPSSPVRLMLKRAQAVATMDFIESLKELNLATEDSMRGVFGRGMDVPAADQPATETPPGQEAPA
ncbi:MAG TPA: type VI secretion system protein TssA [Candidatus Dormibacteraeota bacterium]|nr:type VI secretion system protein TssA [Candidatus Dormibacteraeota bacterium]